MEKESQAANNKVSELKDQLGQSNKNMETLTKDKNDLMDKLDQLKVEASQEKTISTNQRLELEQNLQKINDQLGASVAENNRLKEEIEKIHSEAERLKEQRRAAELDLNKFRSCQEAIMSDLSALFGIPDMSSICSYISQLASEKSECQSSKTLLSTELSLCKDELKEKMDMEDHLLAFISGCGINGASGTNMKPALDKIMHEFNELKCERLKTSNDQEKVCLSNVTFICSTMTLFNKPNKRNNS